MAAHCIVIAIALELGFVIGALELSALRRVLLVLRLLQFSPPPLASAFIILNSNTVTIEKSPSNTCPDQYVTSCPSLTTLIPSTLSLTTSRAYAGGGNSVRSSSELSSLLDSQTSTSSIPLLRYPSTNDNDSPYLPNSIYPSELGWTNDAFNRSDNDAYIPGSTPTSSNMNCPKNVSSISGPPYHAVISLENFYFSPQTSLDVENLQSEFNAIYEYHEYLHTKRLPFEMNVIHPFESGVELGNPMWEEALEEAIGVYEDEGWTPNPPVPDSVRNLPTFPSNEKIYYASLYLLECISHFNTEVKLISENCPFSMVDVGFASALAAGDVALKQIALILKEKNKEVGGGVEGVLNGWVEKSGDMIESLWDEGSKKYSNRISTNANTTHFMTTSNVATDFFPPFGLYSSVRAASTVIDNKEMLNSRLDSLVFNLLEEFGDDSFACGVMPIPGSGCKSIHRNRDGEIDPFINWVAARGFEMQNAKGVGHWIRNSTIDLVCGQPFSENWGECDELFPRHFNYDTGAPLPGVCKNASAVTAAAFVNLVFQDPVLSFESAPPLNTTWVLVIIVAELVVAFSIGIMCTVFSVNLFKKLRKDKTEHAEDSMFDNIRNDQLEQLGLVGWEGGLGEGGIKDGSDTEANEDEIGSSWSAIKSFVKVLW
ncbi:hypothetical protein TrLO_g15427 [Triparma laevis f. longispina]|uniref:Uncharacterized protein n=1 Tax=Triparma laevis f. longispina TaxID=1714387 RepID=A0A9W7APT4_9STRA|nr:hypothetical protein TrLO_g15427 [Triparma laevis f. longispina]